MSSGAVGVMGRDTLSGGGGKPCSWVWGDYKQCYRVGCTKLWLGGDALQGLWAAPYIFRGLQGCTKLWLGAVFSRD